MTITSTLEFQQQSSALCGQMVSLDSKTRKEASEKAQFLLNNLPKFIKNNKTNFGEINAIETLIAKVSAE